VPVLTLLGLIQHDQVKVEVLQQNIIPLMVRCVTEKQSFHSTRVQQYAIEILLALSFNADASTILEKDPVLIQCLVTLKSSKRELIRRAASHLTWQLEKMHSDPRTNPSDAVIKSKFDVMISYSHTDKKLCFEICDFLERDGYHVWLDRDRMHGDAIVAMADAIENSELIIVCMSTGYKSSPYCQSEASYAFQRQCKLVTLVMKPKYKPDGWLGFITSGKIYVDFTKHDFQVACSLLKREIENKRETVAKRTNVSIGTHESMMSRSPPEKADARPSVM
jgi:hypothetical protein